MTLENQDSLSSNELKSLRFPLICKPFQACGTVQSHEMAIVFRIKDFNTLQSPFPLLVQEFLNHNGIIYKIFVVETQFQVVKRNSIPDLDPNCNN